MKDIQFIYLFILQKEQVMRTAIDCDNKEIVAELLRFGADVSKPFLV